MYSWFALDQVVQPGALSHTGSLCALAHTMTSATMQVMAMGSVAELTRPCVDCGMYTGSFCEMDCLAVTWVPSERWCAGQHAPHCTKCELKFTFCHFCRKSPWATPPAWGVAPPVEVDSDESDESSEGEYMWDPNEVAQFLSEQHQSVEGEVESN